VDGVEVNGYTIGPGAILFGADLEGADLAGAFLFEADLRRANLTGADLSRADLAGDMVIKKLHELRERQGPLPEDLVPD